MKKKTVKTVITYVIIVLLLTLIPVGSYYGFNCLVSKDDKLYLDKVNNIVSESLEEKDTLSDIVYDLKKRNIDVVNHQFNKRSQELVYNQVTKKFGVLNPFGVVSYPKEAKAKDRNDLWRFVSEEKQLSKKYSNYLMDNFKEDGDGILNIYTGLDVGNNSSAYEINVYHKKEHEMVKLVTKNGNIHFHDGSSYFVHYGIIDEVVFENNKVYRYGEYGNVKFMDIISGNIYLNEKSIVKKIYVNKSNVEPFIFIDSIDSIFNLGKEEDAIVKSNFELSFLEIEKEKFKNKEF